VSSMTVQTPLAKWLRTHTDHNGVLVTGIPHDTGYESVMKERMLALHRARQNKSYQAQALHNLYTSYCHYTPIMDIPQDEELLAKVSEALKAAEKYKVEERSPIAEEQKVKRFLQTGKPFRAYSGYSYLFLDVQNDVVKTSQGMTLKGTIESVRQLALRVLAQSPGNNFSVDTTNSAAFAGVVEEDMVVVGCHRVLRSHIIDTFNLYTPNEKGVV